MTFTDAQIKELAAPLERRFVKPPAPGRYGDYLEGWHCIAEANRIFGFDGWNRETTTQLLGEPIKAGDKWNVSYSAKVRITVGGVIRDGSGFGQGIDRDLGRAHESALKEAETDAMKRALMTFGNPFGLALYDKKQTNVTAAPVDDGKVVNPATGRKVDPMSANQAKKDGRAEAAVKLAHEMTDIMEVTELLAWRTSKTAEVETWPPAWQTALWDQYDLHLEELRTIIARELGADAETGEVIPA